MSNIEAITIITVVVTVFIVAYLFFRRDGKRWSAVLGAFFAATGGGGIIGYFIATIIEHFSR